MNVFAILFALICLLGLKVAAAMPAKDNIADLQDEVPELFKKEMSLVEEPEHGVRLGRATCDLLSMSTPWGQANHSICAAHCLAMRKGFRGGRCKDGVCHCRR